jgi:hypothetical protein
LQHLAAVCSLDIACVKKPTSNGKQHSRTNNQQPTKNQDEKARSRLAGLQYHMDGMDGGRKARSRSTMANGNVNVKPSVPQFVSRTSHGCPSAILITSQRSASKQQRTEPRSVDRRVAHVPSAVYFFTCVLGVSPFENVFTKN